MKVFLINPPSYKGIDFVREGRCAERTSAFSYSLPPHTLMSIATLMRKGNFQPKITDCIEEHINFRELEHEIKKENPGMIIINTTTPTIHGDLKVGRIAKKYGIFSALVGTFPSVMDEWCLRNSKADAVVRNEPEITSLELAKRISRQKNLKNVRGVTFREGNRIIRNKPRPFERDMEKFRVEARDLVNNRLYKMPFSNDPVAMVAPSRGCPFNCTFCITQNYYGNRLRSRKAECIFEEIRDVYNSQGIKDIALWAESFLIDKKGIRELMTLLKGEKMDINLYITSRVDSVDYPLMKRMKSSGFRSIGFGVESGSQEILDRCRKGITTAQSRDAINSAKKAGLQTMCHMIFGLPGETPETMRASLNFALKTDPDFYNFYTAIPYPGTEFYR
ncbi:MAG: radical SAM protein, partial [Candidatus Aenigmatarchaeota archaeon]